LVLAACIDPNGSFREYFKADEHGNIVDKKPECYRLESELSNVKVELLRQWAPNVNLEEVWKTEWYMPYAKR
jgi:hypothetical protein